MIFPSDFEEKLGFNLIRKLLADNCLSSLGRSRIERIAFSTDPDEIEKWLSETAEMKQIVQFEERFPAQDYYDMVPDLMHVRIPGSYLEPDRLSELRLSLITILNLYRFYDKNREKYPSLWKIAGGAEEAEPSGARRESSDDEEEKGITAGPEGPEARIGQLLKELDRIINEKSEVRDTASEELHRIRQEKEAKQATVEREVIRCFKMAHNSGWTPDDAEVTIRNGRLVIPLISAHKRKIPGFVHDASATGHTIFIEPAEIFETNNEIRELEYAERREIVRILIELAAFIRPSVDALLHDYQFLGTTDFIRAKAKLAAAVDGWKPMLTSEQSKNQATKAQPAAEPEAPEEPRGGFIWRSAIHPLLLLNHQKQSKPVVPLDIEMNSDRRILIISGPNAGGKSVCLKTVGLLQYMLQCGLLPPVKEDSEFALFENLFIDIGDEQSIDNDLSTYTSKLFHLKYFLEHITENSLFLIDELGAGTDPSLGGAIAEATLEALNARKAYGVVTTHYSNLKLLASREQGIVNGAMLFDLKRLKPLYRLKTGKPGSSFALEIAQEIGFPKEVLKRARRKTGRSQLDFDRELQNLEVEKEEVARKEQELAVADQFLAELVKKYEQLTANLESKKKEILEKARSEAQELLDRSNQIVEKTIREIREAQAEKSRTKKVREELNKVKTELTGNPAEEKKETARLVAEKLIEGRQVSPPVKRVVSPYQSYLNDLQNKAEHFSLTLDLRGKRVEEALPLLQRFFDDAILLSFHQVRVLHGKGNGVLRQVTRDYLRSVKEVKSARDASLETGGAGITEVEL